VNGRSAELAGDVVFGRLLLGGGKDIVGFTEFHQLGLDEQIGLCLHAAALATLVGDAELATRLRHRAGDQETARRQQEARFRIALVRFQLADTPSSRLQLNAVLAVLLENLVSKP